MSLGTWDWDDVENKVISLDLAPAAARLAAEIISDAKFDDGWEAEVCARTGLPQFSLVEWSVCSEVESIFELLRRAGSQIGYIVGMTTGCHAESFAREIALTSTTAEQIHHDLAMELPMAFVDDQQMCALVSYHSDYTLICLREDLFEQWLESRPLDLTLWASETPYTPATDLQTARKLAQRRAASWHDHVRLTSMH